ncbi:MAG: hypothetical protein WD068_01220 [Candidatus Babeliales bacterium]
MAHQQFTHTLIFIAILSLVGCASNPDACQRVQKRHQKIRDQKLINREKKLISTFKKDHTRIKEEYKKALKLTEDPFASQLEKEEKLIHHIEKTMDPSTMSFWEGFHPVNDALANYPVTRYAYWLHAQIETLQKYQTRFTNRSLDTNKIDRLIQQLNTLDTVILQSNRYAQEQEAQHTRKHRIS